jgi:glycosyltransferase involved in cell wall biosynthesis
MKCRAVCSGNTDTCERLTMENALLEQNAHSPRTVDRSGTVPRVSIVIKALNEAHNIGRTVDSIWRATEGLAVEVILADSLSTDDTVGIALGRGADVVQLESAHDRSCGVGPQLGYQYSRGEFIFLVDGDMEIVPGFIERALAVMDRDPSIAGVAGQIEEMSLENRVFAQRLQRNRGLTAVGPVDQLDMGGIYRRSAIEDVGYFSNGSLHSYEELELGCRLRAAGWKMQRLDGHSVRHYGHELPRYQLLMRRYRSRYAWGPGELLRAGLGKPWFGNAIKTAKAYLVVIAGWALLCGAALMLPWTALPLGVALLAQPVFLALLMLKRRSISDGLFTYASWNVFALGTLRGFMRTPKDPTRWIPSKRIAATHVTATDRAG